MPILQLVCPAFAAARHAAATVLQANARRLLARRERARLAELKRVWEGETAPPVSFVGELRLLRCLCLLV